MFIIRFESEFVRKKELGKGGFGVVYHVTNSLDKADYAVKITKLPDE